MHLCILCSSSASALTWYVQLKAHLHKQCILLSAVAYWAHHTTSRISWSQVFSLLCCGIIHLIARRDSPTIIIFLRAFFQLRSVVTCVYLSQNSFLCDWVSQYPFRWIGIKLPGSLKTIKRFLQLKYYIQHCRLFIYWMKLHLARSELMFYPEIPLGSCPMITRHDTHLFYWVSIHDDDSLLSGIIEHDMRICVDSTSWSFNWITVEPGLDSFFFNFKKKCRF